MSIKCSNISMMYGNKKQIQSLSDVSICIESGTFLSIIGKSGSGKSTLLHVLSGLLKPTHGSVELNDVDLYALNDTQRSKLRRQHIGFVFQSFNLFPELSVYRNICVPLALDKKSVDTFYFKELIDILEIEDTLERFPSELSGGQQQRVAIARALISKPQVIFADEPTGNLDEETSLKVMALLGHLQETYKPTIVLVTHDFDISNYAERRITLSDGKIIDDVSLGSN